jgi:hypothetical protein
VGTVRQIYEWHTSTCRKRGRRAEWSGSFLPPYNLPRYEYDGLGMESVEFWSGGFQLVTNIYCNMQRIIPLEPHAFSAALLYHTSNNKQFAPNVRHRYSDRSINYFWGQLNTVRRNAESKMRDSAAG